VVPIIWPWSRLAVAGGARVRAYVRRSFLAPHYYPLVCGQRGFFSSLSRALMWPEEVSHWHTTRSRPPGLSSSGGWTVGGTLAGPRKSCPKSTNTYLQSIKDFGPRRRLRQCRGDRVRGHNNTEHVLLPMSRGLAFVLVPRRQLWTDSHWC
jgi:hypothetical protein